MKSEEVMLEVGMKGLNKKKDCSKKKGMWGEQLITNTYKMLL